MAIKLMTHVWEREVTGTEQAVLLCLADYANDEGLCWPGVDRIAWKIGASDRTVRRALNALEERGAIEKQRRFGSSTVYTLHLETLPEKKPFIPRSGQNDRSDTERRKPVTDDRMIRSQLCPHDSVIAVTDKPLEEPSEGTVSSAAAPLPASESGSDSIEAESPSAETGPHPPTPSPKERAALKAELNRYWAAFKSASGLSPLAIRQMQGKARGQIEQVLSDPEASRGITIRAFGDQVGRTRQRLEARGALQYLTPAEVFADMGREQSREASEQTRAEKLRDLIAVYEAWKWGREGTRLFVGPDERKAQMRADIVSSLGAALSDTPTLSPLDFLHALEWRWYLEPLGEQRPCRPADLRWAVQTWVRDGRQVRAVVLKTQAAAELATKLMNRGDR